MQIQWLQERLAKLNGPDLGQVNEIKRGLKAMHRGLEKVHVERCPGQGDKLEASVGYVVRYAWRTYMSAVKLEERMKGLGSSTSQILACDSTKDGNEKDKRAKRGGDVRKVHDSTRDGNGKDDSLYMNREVRKTCPSTSRKDRKSERQRPSKARRQYVESEPGEELFLVSGALPIEDETTWAPSQGVEPDDPLDALTITPHLYYPDLTSKTSITLSVVETNPEQIPQPRHEVKARLQEEEANSSFGLLDPDRVRRGSCNGFMITEMTMRGLEEPEFVLPYLHYMKIHELRCLKEWLADTGNVMQSQPVSRMEKVLLCMQLLQSGCRYEALAVIHSRSPRQVKGSCNEVMQGLLHWHALTVQDQDIGDQAKSLVLWGIWDRYCASDGRAGLYFGFDWTHLAKVLVALNVYMGRWRMQGRFAVDGPAFTWGKFFGPETQVPDGAETDEEELVSNLGDDCDSFETDPSGQGARRGMLRERAQAEG